MLCTTRLTALASERYTDFARKNYGPDFPVGGGNVVDKEGLLLAEAGRRLSK